MFGTDRRSNLEIVIKVVIFCTSIIGLILFEKAVMGVEYTSMRNEILAVGFGFFAYLYSISSTLSALLFIVVKDPVSEDIHKHPRLVAFGMISMLLGIAIVIQLLFWAVVIQNINMGIAAVVIAAILALTIIIITKTSR